MYVNVHLNYRCSKSDCGVYGKISKPKIYSLPASKVIISCTKYGNEYLVSM